jgi:DNA-binding transcriptional MerR regulator/quercetin dioxygenase-like cupin family protein
VGGRTPSEPQSPAGVQAPAALGSAVGNLYIQQAASMVGATAVALRTWEQQGLITPGRTASGYRLYSMADIQRLRRIQTLFAAGVNAAGIRRLLDGSAATSTATARGALADAGHVRTVGQTVREWRRRKSLTLRGLGDLTGLSASYISAVERGLAAPSIASLQKLGAAFGTNVLALMADSYEPPDTPVVRASGRRVLEGDNGVTIEDLSTAGSNLEPLIFTFEPGSGSDGPISHEGEEFLYVMSGTLQLELDGSDVHQLAAGDSMAFRSERSHQFSNPGSGPAVVLWINTPRTF